MAHAVATEPLPEETVIVSDSGTIEAARRRLLSLDVFRGATIILMLVVNNSGWSSGTLAPLRHAAWHGLTVTDLVFPFFLFIMGVAMAFSFGRRREQGQSAGRMWGKIIFRTVALIALGIALGLYRRLFTANGLALASDMDWSSVRIFGVLQRIGICYFFAAFFIFFWGRPRPILATIIALLVSYWALMVLVFIPGRELVADPWANGNTFAQWLDLRVLGSHSYMDTLEPEGIVSTLPAIVNVLIGYLAGTLLRRLDRTPAEKTAGVFTYGSLLIFLALFLAGGWAVSESQNILFMPINKKIWTGSYALLTCGLALLALGAAYWAIDVQGRRKWTQPFLAFGSNAILAYFCGSLLAAACGLHKFIDAPWTTERVSIKDYVTQGFFNTLERIQLDATAQYFTALIWPLLLILVIWAFVSILHRFKIFVRL